MKLGIATIFIFCLSIISGLAFAGREDKRQGMQRARIHQGVKSGELSHKEAAHLRRGERHIRRMEHRAEADGQVTAREAAKIESAQDKMSEEIYKEKHDDN